MQFGSFLEEQSQLSNSMSPCVEAQVIDDRKI